MSRRSSTQENSRHNVKGSIQCPLDVMASPGEHLHSSRCYGIPEAVRVHSNARLAGVGLGKNNENNAWDGRVGCQAIGTALCVCLQMSPDEREEPVLAPAPPIAEGCGGWELVPRACPLQRGGGIDVKGGPLS